MLKKAGIAVAAAAAGMLALSPFAFADDEDQDNYQHSLQGEGEANGKNVLSGLAEQNFGGPCPLNVVEQAPGTVQGGGTCTNTPYAGPGQVEKQHRWNH